MSVFHFRHNRKEEQQQPGGTTPGSVPAGTDAPADASGWNIGIGGVSIEAFMEQFDQDMAPDERVTSSVANAEVIEIITCRDYPGAQLSPEDEAQQQLTLSRNGAVMLRSVKYFKGRGHYGIGRYVTVRVNPSTITEIFKLMDTWLFMADQKPWSGDDDHGSWTIRVRHEEGHTEMMRGALDGAVVDTIDLSQFIRERIPIPDLFVFDRRQAALP